MLTRCKTTVESVYRRNVDGKSIKLRAFVTVVSTVGVLTVSVTESCHWMK